MSNQLEEIKCPFYQSTRRVRSWPTINCEGLYDGAISSVRFKDLESYFRHKVSFCESIDNCPKCPYFQVASFKYT